MSDLNSIEKIKRKIYSKNKEPEVHERKGLRKGLSKVSNKWKTHNNKKTKIPKEDTQKFYVGDLGEESPEEKVSFEENQINVMPSAFKNKKNNKKKHSKAVYLLIFSFVFFLVAAGVGYVFLVGTPSFVSSKKVDISIAGPANIQAGENASFKISITNRNSSALEVADLVMEFPKGVRNPESGEKMEERRIMLGTIKSGETINKTINAVFFGKKNSEKEFTAILEYRIQGSNAIFSADKKYPVSISSSPLDISVESLDEIVSGKEVVFEVKVNSNSQSTVEDVLLVADYPFGFSFISASEDPAFGDKVWKFGDIPPGGEKEITIKGKLQGQESEERIFRFNAGMKSREDNNKLAATLASSEKNIAIKEPFLGVEFVFNGNKTSDFVIESGKKVKADLIWQNNTSSKLFNVEISSSLDGHVFDGLSVSTSRGFYNSSQKRLIWDENSMDELQEVPSGDSGKVSFSFDIKDLMENNLSNPEIPISVDVSASRSSGGGRVPEQVKSTIKGLVKVSSELNLTSRAVYSVGEFENTGPLPPVAEEITTYTILWTVTNSSNDIENAKVSTSLPSYVEWTGKSRVSTGEMRYKPVGGEVEWNVGEIPAGKRAEGAFQISLTPSVNQIGTNPSLTGSQQISGFDEFTETQIRHYVEPRTIEISTDPVYNRDDGEVSAE